MSDINVTILLKKVPLFFLLLLSVQSQFVNSNPIIAANVCCGNTTVTTSLTNRAELESLVGDWKDDVEGIENEYGSINCWDTSSVTAMNGIFKDISFNFDVSCWDVSSVEDFRSTFFNSKFNNSLSNWNTQSAKTVRQMFRNADDFDQDLSNFDTSKVTDLRQMFLDADSFTGKGLETWDVKSVKTSMGAFKGALSFNGNLTSWCLSSNEDMQDMFLNANSFEGGDLSTWADCLGNIETMQAMFRQIDNLQVNVAGWNLPSLTNMFEMFYDCGTCFNSETCSEDTKCNPMGVDSWSLGNVENMERVFMFTELDADLSNWDGK